MLLSFSVKNHRSFRDEQTLSMIASSKLHEHQSHCIEIPGGQEKALRTAVIFGANAAGKSNLIKSIAFAQRGIRQRIPLVQTPFAFDPESSQRPSEFDFQFLIDGIVWSYGYSRHGRHVGDEYLVRGLNFDEDFVFQREFNGEIKLGRKELFSDPKVSSVLLALQQLGVRSNQLFLSKVGEQKNEIIGVELSGVYKWLTKDLVVGHGDGRDESIVGRIAKDTAFNNFASTFLDYTGTGVQGFNVEESDIIDPALHEHLLQGYGLAQNKLDSDYEIDKSAKRVIQRTLHSLHKIPPTKEVTLPFSLESDGTRRLLELMPALFSLGKEDRTYIMDEFDNSLHPLLCREFVRFFGDSCPNARSQLIITTHESILLDQDLLRRDEYWFVEKDESQQSMLTSLADFKIRNDLQIQKGYLQGRFSAIPIFGDPSKIDDLVNNPIGDEKTDTPYVDENEET